jgi:hypothetical protein
MDRHFRVHLEDEDPVTGVRTMEPELEALYGLRGGPVPDHLTAIEGSDDDFFKELITRRLMEPFNDYLVVPSQKAYFWLVRREGNPYPKGLGGRTVNSLVIATEGTLAAAFVAVAIIAVYNIPSLKYRIVTTGILNLPFLYLLAPLSPEAIKIFTLTVT